MKLLPIQEAYKRKFDRQKKIKKLEYHASGHCVHIGKISPGCYRCFTPNKFAINILSGMKCNAKCTYCTTDKKGREPTKTTTRNLKLHILRNSCLPDYNPSKFSFTGGGEPLMYVNRIAEFMKVIRDAERCTQKRPWHYLYTNGLLADNDMLLRLRNLGFDEIRFHLGATNFSEKVYKNLKNATRYFKVVSVETPAWPPHRKKLFEMLPRINDIGVKHLNIGEIEINKNNLQRICQVLPDVELYQCYEMHLYDGGLVYDIFEEVIRKKYSYSVLDCSLFVKSIQRGPAKNVCREDLNGLFAEY